MTTTKPLSTTPRGREDLLLDSLGYVGVSSDRLDDWQAFATGVAGMQLGEASAKTRILRIDDRAARFLIADDGGSSGFAGFEVSDAAALDRVARRLDEHGVRYVELSGAERDLRRVTAGIALADPDGNRIEVFHGAATADAFVPSRSISGFRTGTQGLGHFVLLTPEPRRLVDFYLGVLGFRMSDYMLKPFEGYFFHLNTRHHSLALVKYPASGIHHVMVELNSLDDMGQGLDLAEQSPDGVAVTIGRHSNDHMLSFYARTPSMLMLEYGWGGLSIDVDRWIAHELPEGPSIWGHERSWLPDDLRAKALQARLQAARDGLRYPVHVREGAFDVMPADDTWRPNTAR